jgi:lactate dehydrogenase-like 2-hydroxyacid dehydrogenase
MAGEPFVYITRALPDVCERRLRKALPQARIEVNREERALSPEELRLHAAGADAVVCTLVDRIDRPFFEATAPSLRVLATFAVGYENLDLAAARDHGVRVSHTPGVLTEATAEITIALLLDCARRISECERVTRRGDFGAWQPQALLGRALFGKTVGIVGAGRIGQRVATTLRRGFDCTIQVHSRTPRPDWERELDARFVSLETLLETSDFVSLHCPLLPETRHLIDAAALARMPAHACLVNTARGPIVDEAALVRALESGAIAAAGLDVYEEEPKLAAGLDRLENVVLLPHIGSATREARDAMALICAEAVIAVLGGGAPAHALA